MKLNRFSIIIFTSLLVIITIIISKGCISNRKIEPVLIDSSAAKYDSSKIKTDSVMITDSAYSWGKIEEGDGLTSAILRLPGIKMSHALEITNALMEKLDSRSLKAGQTFKLRLSLDSSKVEEFVFYQNQVDYFVLKQDSSDSLICNENKFPTTRRVRVTEGSLQTTLDAALGALNLPMVLRQTVNNILECTVSFQTDARKGDTFKIMVEEEFFEDSVFVGGKVLYASYLGVKTGLHEGFYYEESDPKSAFNSHYTRDGRALVNSGLRIPVDRVHVTSTYGYRIHPITGKNTMHNGVDYRGNTGDPVYAACSGRVKDVVRTPLGGNQITITHADGTETYYLHLSRFSVKRGQIVKSRQVIGAIGSTGRSTGPHLHFGVKQKNHWLNPLSRHMIATPKLDGKRFAALQQRILKLDNQIGKEILAQVSDNLLRSILNYSPANQYSLLNKSPIIN